MVKVALRAFTLIEVIVATALIAIVLGGLWGGVSFSGKATKNSMLQSDALNAADSTFRKLKIFLAACEKLEFPVADSSSEFAIVTDSIGEKWAITLHKSKRAIIVSAVNSDEAYKLFSTNQTLLKFTEVDFYNLGGKDLRMTVKLANINGDELKSLTSFIAVFKVGS